MKLWQQDKDSLQEVTRFTVGKDREMDMLLASFDVLGSRAHIHRTQSNGLLSEEDLKGLSAELKNIHHNIVQGDFTMSEEREDIHSQIELELTKKKGDVGKKIHSGRSRNDQVLV